MLFKKACIFTQQILIFVINIFSNFLKIVILSYYEIKKNNKKQKLVFEETMNIHFASLIL